MIVEVLSYSRFHIDVQVCEHNGDKPWRFIGFYGEPYTSKRQESWTSLRLLKTKSTLP